MKKIIYVFSILLIVSCITVPGYPQGNDPVTCTEKYGTGDTILNLATGSPGELGLLKELALAFNKKYSSSICWVKAGSGESLKLLKDKRVEIIMVHAPDAEKAAVKEGWAGSRTLIGSNEFYIVGPGNDPAGIRNAKSAVDAYKKIASSQSIFLSRGDNSGTHKKELSIWKSSGITPEGKWYVVTKDFMMATLKKADDLKGYFMSDSSTWVTVKNGVKNLTVLYKGDPVLINTYHALCQPEYNNKKYKISKEFINFLSGGEGQLIITDYGKSEFGEAMYNNAEASKKYVH
jgi:tungstate transport system substrate-binding protein